MARIRTIKPGFFKHGDLFDAEVESGLPLRIAYAGLWTIADRDGRFKWKPRDIKPDVLPYDNVSMVEVMDALAAKAFIQKYTVDGHEYGYIPAFLEHQHINVREPKSNIPEPVRNKNARAKRVPKQDRNDEEGKGREGKESIVAGAPFDDFWKAYPKREARGAALRAFDKACGITAAITLIEAAGAYATKRAGQDKQFTKLPATWLNQQCWLDDGVAPAPLPDAEAIDQASTAWGGLAAPLVADIGAPQFSAWFGDTDFTPGPPVARIIFKKPFCKNWVATHFVAPLRKHFGDFELVAA